MFKVFKKKKKKGSSENYMQLNMTESNNKGYLSYALSFLGLWVIIFEYVQDVLLGGTAFRD